MLSVDTIAFFALVVVLGATVFFNRSKLSFQRWMIFYVAMYRTRAGIKTMDAIAKKFRPLLLRLAPIIIGIGFLGMAFVTIDLARGLIMVLSGVSAPSAAVVAPFKAKGVFYVPFFYWIVSLFSILVIHEGMHGVMARVYGLPVRSSGLIVLGAVVPLIPGAFVEPDEKKLTAAPIKQQLAVYAAGPVSNVVTGVLLMLLFFMVLVPMTDQLYAHDGVVITDVMEGNPPAAQVGLSAGEKITAINGQAVRSPSDFTTILAKASPGDRVSVLTSNSVYDVTLAKNPKSNKALLGVYVDRELVSPSVFTQIVLWVKELVFWLGILSVGVGFFNLVPLGPIDGGRMFLTALESVTHQSRAHKIWKSVSFVVLGILLTSIILVFL